MYNRLVVFKFLLFLLPFFGLFSWNNAIRILGSNRNSCTFMSNVSTDWFLAFARLAGEIWVAKTAKSNPPQRAWWIRVGTLGVFKDSFLGRSSRGISEFVISTLLTLKLILSKFEISISSFFFLGGGATVDGSELLRSPVDMVNLPFYTCWVVGLGISEPSTACFKKSWVESRLDVSWHALWTLAARDRWIQYCDQCLWEKKSMATSMASFWSWECFGNFWANSRTPRTFGGYIRGYIPIGSMDGLFTNICIP